MDELLIAGYGDIARRALSALERRFHVTRLSRQYGVDLDRPVAARTADAVLHCAPPPATGNTDPRTAHLLAALTNVSRLVYISTSGVYGNCADALVDEGHPVNPRTPRARRRVDAEAQLQHWCAERRVALIILRAPGIY